MNILKRAAIWCSLFVGAGLHLLVKFLDMAAIEVPSYVHLISSLGYILFAILMGCEYFRLKKTIAYLGISFLIITILLCAAEKFEWMHIGDSMMLLGLPIPIVLWFFSLCLSSFMLAFELTGKAKLEGIIQKAVTALSSSVITLGYFIVTMPSIDHRQDWHILVKGGYYGVSIAFFLIGALIVFVLNAIYVFSTDPKKCCKNSIPVWAYYCMLFGLTLLSSYIYELYSNFMIARFVMLPFILYGTYRIKDNEKTEV